MAVVSSRYGLLGDDSAVGSTSELSVRAIERSGAAFLFVRRQNERSLESSDTQQCKVVRLIQSASPKFVAEQLSPLVEGRVANLGHRIIGRCLLQHRRG